MIYKNKFFGTRINADLTLAPLMIEGVLGYPVKLVTTNENFVLPFQNVDEWVKED